MADVYRGMDQETLDREYNARATVADFDAEMARYRQMSAESQAACEVVELAYGDHPDERVDFYPAGAGAPVLVYIHGGYWRLLGRAESAFMARAMVGAGVAVAVVEHTLAPEASLDRIVAQCRRAVAEVHRRAGELGADAERLWVSGSSAGGHLAAMCMATDWTAFGRPDGIVQGAVPVSGLFDLQPVRLTAPQAWLNLSEEDAERNSPMRMSVPAGLKVALYWGAEETSEFKRQSLEYAEVLRGQGVEVTAREVPGRNHFDVVTELGEPDSAMFAEVVDLMT